MTWLTIALISLVAASIHNVIQAVVAKRSSADSLTLSVFYVGSSRIGMIGYAALLGPINAVAALNHWWLVVLNMIFFPLAHILSFQGLKYLDASLRAIIFSSWVIYTVIGSTIILNESINIYQWIGLVLILFGVVLAHAPKGKSKNLKKGIAYTLIAAVLYGSGGVADKAFFDATDFTTFFVFGSGSTGVTLIGMYIWHQKVKGRSLLPKAKSVAWKFLLVGTALLILSNLTYFAALEKVDNVSRLSAVNSFSIILTVLLGVVFLREYANLKMKLVAAAISTVGFLLLI